MQEHSQDNGISTTIPQTVLPTKRRPSRNVLQTQRIKQIAIVSLIQMALGFICIFLGIAEYVKLHFWAKRAGSGMVAGSVLLFDAVICFFTARRARNNYYNGLGILNMFFIFSLISGIVSLGEIVIATYGIKYYKKGLCHNTYRRRSNTVCSGYPDENLGIAIYATLIALMAQELIFAIIGMVCALIYFPDDRNTTTIPQINSEAQITFEKTLQPLKIVNNEGVMTWGEKLAELVVRSKLMRMNQIGAYESNLGKTSQNDFGRPREMKLHEDEVEHQRFNDVQLVDDLERLQRIFTSKQTTLVAAAAKVDDSMEELEEEKANNIFKSQYKAGPKGSPMELGTRNDIYYT